VLVHLSSPRYEVVGRIDEWVAAAGSWGGGGVVVSGAVFGVRGGFDR
jgi:hypothetical protein